MATATYTYIAKYTATGSSGTFDFTSIPQTYQHLEIIVSSGYGGGATGALTFNFNNDTTSNYYYAYWAGNPNGGSPYYFSGGSTSQSYGWGLYTLSGYSNMAGFSRCIIQDYSVAGAAKSYYNEGTGASATSAANLQQAVTGGQWKGTAAITTISVGNSNGQNFTSGSTFYLYGIKKS